MWEELPKRKNNAVESPQRNTGRGSKGIRVFFLQTMRIVAKLAPLYIAYY
jgi:hypothetical protein